MVSKTKAASKQKAKAATKRKAKFNMKTAPQLPNGYKVIGRAPNWDVEKHPVIEGVRGKAKSVVMNEGTKKEYEVRTMIVTDDEVGAVTVWESALLTDLFDNTDDGDNIRIEFNGYGPKKPGQNPPKLFTCGIKGE